jgi:hypothetical protein
MKRDTAPGGGCAVIVTFPFSPAMHESGDRSSTAQETTAGRPAQSAKGG